jgi:hypothetical protein
VVAGEWGGGGWGVGETTHLVPSQVYTPQRGVLFFFSLFVRNCVVLFRGLVAERQYNPPSSFIPSLVCCVSHPAPGVRVCAEHAPSRGL